MSLLNQAAVDALCSATYLETYLDCAENLPNELQRYITQLRDLDFQTNGMSVLKRKVSRTNFFNRVPNLQIMY